MHPVTRGAQSITLLRNDRYRRDSRLEENHAPEYFYPSPEDYRLTTWPLANSRCGHRRAASSARKILT